MSIFKKRSPLKNYEANNAECSTMPVESEPMGLRDIESGTRPLRIASELSQHILPRLTLEAAKDLRSEIEQRNIQTCEAIEQHLAQVNLGEGIATQRQPSETEQTTPVNNS